jgi:hypothetical protein
MNAGKMAMIGMVAALMVNPLVRAESVRFRPTDDRALMKGDFADGTFTVGITSVRMSHAYVQALPDPFDEAKMILRLKLTDIPVDPRSFGLSNKVDEGTLHYIELSISGDRRVTDATLHHKGLRNGFLSISGGITFNAGLFGPSQFAGVVSASGEAYAFSVKFKATLYEISGAPLGLKPDGSFGIAEGGAMGTFSVDGKAFAFAHALARTEKSDDGENFTVVLLTEKPMPREVIAEGQPFFYAVQGTGIQALYFKLDTKGEPSGWHWWHANLDIGCYQCSDLVFVPVKGKSGTVKGTVYSRWPQTWESKEYEFKASFNAVILPPTKPKPPAEEREPEEASPAEPQEATPEQVPAEVKHMSPLEDPAEVVRMIKEKIGKPFKAIELVLYPDLAVLQAQDSAQPKNFDEFTYRDGAVGGPEPKQEWTVTCQKGFALETVDFSLLPKLMKDALQRIKGEGGHVTHVVLNRTVFCEDVSWSVYVESPRASGYVLYKLNGKMKSVFQ